MSFLYPLGLLGLLGIPVLIIIYIIKSKYTEQTVSSTFLWMLSEKFLKRRNPLNRLTGMISLLLQILIVTAISLAIAHPMIITEGTSREYCFLLDGSVSMQMQHGETTRFDEGKSRVAEIIEDATDGSIFSLVYMGDTASVVYDRIADKEQALDLLDGLTPSYGSSNMTDAIGVAQKYFNQNTSTLVYLITDKRYETANNITLVDLSSDVENYGISDVTYTYVGGKLTVKGMVVSYASDAVLTTELYVNESTEASAGSVVVTVAGEKTPFQLVCEAAGFASFRVAVTESDALALDNEISVYDVKSENSYSTLIVSATPFFLSSMFDALINAETEVISPDEYRGQRGYGLYVFDSFVPDEMPNDGAVWMVNPTGSLEGTGFSVQGEVTFGKAQPLELSSSTASAVKKLTEDLTGDTVYVARYVKCGLYRNFATLLSYQGNPVVFAGTNAFGNRQVVLAFDLHNSNLPLLFDYAVLMRNLVSYSFPEMVEKTTYYCGDEVEVNLPANCDSVQVQSPSGETLYPGIEGAVGRFAPTEVGIHTVTMNVSNTLRQFKIHVAVEEAERIPVTAESDFSLQGQATDEGFDGQYDALMVVLIALVILFLADWGLYCYEKYQLR